MQKPKNYDNVSAGGFTPIELGGHKMVIKQVSERKNKNGGDMIVVAFDFDVNDKQAGYFKQLFLDDVRPDKKWPINGTAYINVLNTQNGDCSKNFKSFCTCVENSNKGFNINWDAKDFGLQFKGLAIGGVFGEVENAYNGKITTRHQLRWFCNYDDAGTAKVPATKFLNTTAATNAPKPSTPVDDDEDVPF